MLPALYDIFTFLGIRQNFKDARGIWVQRTRVSVFIWGSWKSSYNIQLKFRRMKMPGRKNTTWCWTWALQREGEVRKEDSWESRINERREEKKRIKKRRIWETANETVEKRKWRVVPPLSSLPRLPFPFLFPPTFNPLRPIGTPPPPTPTPFLNLSHVQIRPLLWNQVITGSAQCYWSTRWWKDGVSDKNVCFR